MSRRRQARSVSPSNSKVLPPSGATAYRRSLAVVAGSTTVTFLISFRVFLAPNKVSSVGQVTYAVRDTEIDGKTIKQDDYMGIGDKSILAVGKDLKQTTLEMVDAMVDEDSAIVSIYFGSESSEEKAEEIASAIEEKYPDVEVEVNDGGQPIYYYVISVE